MKNFYQVNDVLLNVVETGAGNTALVFLHFWGGSSRSWGPVIERLAKTQRCVAIDFRGWGESDKSANDYRLETLADDVCIVISQLGLRDFVVIGHSMGGKVAQLVAARRPTGLKQLILIAPAPPTALKVPAEQRQGMITAYQSRAGVMSIISALSLSEEHRELIVEEILRGSPGAKRAWPELGMLEDISMQVSNIAVPTHIIVWQCGCCGNSGSTA
jgi:pimeloyl-ACP methyl ester carboxylesterase